VNAPDSGDSIANNLDIDVAGTKPSTDMGNAYLRKEDANGQFVNVTNAKPIAMQGTSWGVKFTTTNDNNGNPWSNGNYEGYAVNMNGLVKGPRRDVYRGSSSLA
jgi:hypothetical protein